MAVFAALLVVGCSKEPAVDPDVPYITFEADVEKQFKLACYEVYENWEIKYFSE